MDTTFFSSLIKEGATYRFFDGKEWTESVSGKTVSIISPHDQQLIGTIQQVTNEEIDNALIRAREAQGSWEETPIYKRIAVLQKTADLMREYAEPLTNLLVAEIGKSMEESKSEILRTADILDVTTKEISGVTGEELESDSFPGFSKGKIALVEHVAHGVILAIAPFNYPINLAATKIAPALLMGNAVIFKPPTQGSLAGLYLTQLFIKAGLPPYILTCLTGAGKDMGNYLVAHKDVNMIAFTGSTKVGKAIAEKAGMKPLLFECGGNNATIVLPDADMDLSAKEIVKGAFSYAGQRCTGIKYVLATSDVYATLIPKIEEQMKQLIKVGPPADTETKLVGPVISEDSAKEIEQAIKEAIETGATLITGGHRTGTYIEPTLLKNVTSRQKIVKEEVFGPVLSLVIVSDNNEAINIVNDSDFGLQAAIFTKDEGAGIALGKKLQVGTVQLNGSPQRGPDHFPFMGIKGSGVGVQGIKYSLIAMSRLKSLVLNAPQ